MTFEEAGARFAQAEAQWRAGQMTQEQFQSLLGQLQVQDAAGSWWQIDPSTRQWMKWNGSAWVAASTASPPADRPATSGGTKGNWEGLVSVMPGMVLDAIQRFPVYRENPSMAVGVVAPALLSAVLVPLVPKIGKLLPTVILLGCLVWLAWPVIAQWAEISQEAKGVQSQMGRGLVGMSLVYLLPRIWRTRT